MVAVELYRVMKQIEEFEEKLDSLSTGSKERLELDRELKKARAEKDRLKKMLEGAKDVRF
jgi:transposase-like protein